MESDSQSLPVKEESTQSTIPIVTGSSLVDPEDDWAGMGDRKERRRRQNRLNQRAYRKRKQATRQAQAPPSNQLILIQTIKTEPTGSDEQTMRTISSVSNSVRSSSSPPSSTSTSTSTSTSPSTTIITSTSTSTSTSSSAQPQSLTTTTITNRTRNPCTNPTTQTNLQTLLTHFTRAAYTSYIHNSPTLDHLLTLSRINAFRAFAANMTTLGMGTGNDWMHDDALSRFTTLQPNSAIDTLALPPHLRPTKLQQTVPHHPWLDFFPLPRLRDNLVAMADRFDDEQLCLDIMGFWDTPTETYSLFVWGEPSDPGSWEVSEDFLRKWPWVVRGCAELLESTNRWRAKRGERMLLRYL
ncbi:DUF3425 domain-containing protein [Aspergillus homomorphus CBS 101889]|uniref:BZIP domain-containing protein n=1 Tax=Aspergillus homomorphus (strain CBS 101889) TaxID=1450537 RepID=A0A395I0C5_ASPHC|nr:hypothetical protein BO97DRAFT_469951 [Aspergillus homomorphus CBS 101889]RAL13246.1 hypothetical protein BO97DRAFT_469951 [Aspergillus homomorphus CBS 101889]